MEINLQSKVVLITGASSGIGKAMVKSFASVNATVAIHYNSNKLAAEALAKEVKNNSKSFKANLSVFVEAENLFKEVISYYGKIDVLINSAGIFDFSPLKSENWLELWQKTINTNLTSAGILCKLSIEHFLESEGGRIINLGCLLVSNNY